MREAKTSTRRKIRIYRKPLNINIGMIIFATIFLYICICIAMYFKDNHIKPYEVREGSLYSENLYRGVIIRDEKVITATEAGYVNYYAQEGSRVAKGDFVYTMDESGKLADYIDSEKMGENSLNGYELNQIKSDIINFEHNFSNRDFSSTYEFKTMIKGNVLKYANVALMKNIYNITGENLSAIVTLKKAPDTGVVMYWTDGLETLLPENINSEIYNENTYVKKQYMNNDLVSSSDCVYKLCNNENWSIVIPVDEIKANELLEEAYVKVKFLKNQYESWGEVKILHNNDGKTYAQLCFTNSMVKYTADRYMDIELLIHEERGLKIPNSAIVEREFFLIPEDFVMTNEETKQNSILKETVLENGDRSTEHLTISVYANTEGECYVDADVINSGDHLFKTDSNDNYTVSKRATLIGVYNMNKGYAVFTRIDILYQNEEYAIVKPNTQYGLNVYDLIVQDAKNIKAEQFIYQ